MVTFYVNQSVSKYSNIPEEYLTEGTVSDFLSYYRMNDHISRAQFESKQLELRLVVNANDLVRILTLPVMFPADVRQNQSSDADFAMPSGMPSAGKASRRPDVRSSTTPVGRPSRPVRASAWPKSAAVDRYSRPSKMIPYDFKRLSVTGPDNLSGASFSLPHDAKIECILVASDWLEGRDSFNSGQNFSRTGFLGAGSAKNVIYVRCFPRCPCTIASTERRTCRLAWARRNMLWLKL
jgi:hypothetical protein